MVDTLNKFFVSYQPQINKTVITNKELVCGKLDKEDCINLAAYLLLMSRSTIEEVTDAVQAITTA